MIVTVIGGPSDGLTVSLPTGATTLRLPVARTTDALDTFGPTDPETFSGLLVVEIPIRGSNARWRERRLP